jgi:hypothetical protein
MGSVLIGLIHRVVTYGLIASLTGCAFNHSSVTVNTSGPEVHREVPDNDKDKEKK